MMKMAVIALIGSALFLSGCLPEEKVASSTLDLPSTSPTSPTPSPTIGNGSEKIATTSVNQVFGDRNFVRSTLENVFLSDTSSTAMRTSFNTLYDTYLTPAAANFGGPMSLYSTRGLKELPSASKSSTGKMSNEEMVELPTETTSSPARVAVMNELCRQLMMSSTDLYLTEALRKIGVTAPISTDITANHIQLLYELFAPGTSAETRTVNATLNVVAALRQNNSTISRTEQWRALVYLNCTNPYWQAL